MFISSVSYEGKVDAGGSPLFAGFFALAIPATGDSLAGAMCGQAELISFCPHRDGNALWFLRLTYLPTIQYSITILSL